MLALRKVSAEATSLTLVDVEAAEPQGGQVRIAVTGAGICGTDLHILEGDYPSRPPVTLGHEIAGIVDGVGPGVAPDWLGTLVAPETAFYTCGICRWCRTGRPMLCAERLSIGSGLDGGFASSVIVPARNMHRLPAWLDDRAAALMEPLACVCNALCDPGRIEVGDRVIVSGAGPVGILAAQVARSAGARVTLVGTRIDTGRLALASAIGLDTRSVDDPKDLDALAAESAQRGIDVVVECAGVASAVRSALTWLRPQGRLIQVGLLSGDIGVPFGEIVTRELTVTSGFGSSPASWLRAVSLVSERQVDLALLVTEAIPLRAHAAAFQRLSRREGLKTIFDPRLD